MTAKHNENTYNEDDGQVFEDGVHRDAQKLLLT